MRRRSSTRPARRPTRSSVSTRRPRIRASSSSRCAYNFRRRPTMKLAVAAILSVGTLLAAPLRVAIIGLEHGHVSGFLNGGSALVPAGGALHRPDIQVVGIVEGNRALFDTYAQRLHLPANLYFTNVDDMAAKVHP